MSESHSIHKINTHVVQVKLIRPENHNALNLKSLGELESTISELEKQNIRALIITGTGKSFCSGADLKEIKTLSRKEAKEFSLAGHRVFNKIESFPAPVLAAINGYALGGGCELACACDLRYAAVSARFGQPEAKVGMIPGWGGTFRLIRLIGISKAKELTFTSEIIDADLARQLGLVDKVFKDELLMESVTDIAERIAENAPLAVQLAKSMLNRYPNDKNSMSKEEALALSYCVGTEDQTEAINAFFEKRKPKFNNK